MKSTTENSKNKSLSTSDNRSENFMIDFWLSSVLGIGFVLLTNRSFLVSIITYYVIRFLYYFLFEFMYQRTPGKFETQTIVTNTDGGKPSVFQLLKRNLSRFFSLFSFVSDSEKTIHDEISGTVVVKNIKLKKIKFKRISIISFSIPLPCYWIYATLSKENITNIDYALLVMLVGTIIYTIIMGIKKL